MEEVHAVQEGMEVSETRIFIRTAVPDVLVEVRVVTWLEDGRALVVPLVGGDPVEVEEGALEYVEG